MEEAKLAHMGSIAQLTDMNTLEGMSMQTGLFI